MRCAVRLQEQETLLNEIHGNVAYKMYIYRKARISWQVFVQGLDNIWNTLTIRLLIMQCDVTGCVICISTNLNISSITIDMKKL